MATAPGPNGPLRDKVVLVTGGASGIGAATVTGASLAVDGGLLGQL